MMKTGQYRAGVAAIAAVMTLSSTPAVAQEAATTTVAEEPTSASPPASEPVVVPEAPPVAETVTESADLVAAPVESKSTRTSAKKPVAKIGNAHVAAKAATTTVVAPTAELPDPAASDPAMAADAILPPVAETPPAPAPATAESTIDEEGLIAGGGALALLALSGLGLAVVRRRREQDEALDEEIFKLEPEPAVAPPVRPAPAPEPALVTPSNSAFSWGAIAPRATPPVTREPSMHANESWVERAYRGPSPDNPSQSLRKRLKRAAFFDRREREAAAGTAERVDAGAGLPDQAMAPIHHCEPALA